MRIKRFHVVTLFLIGFLFSNILFAQESGEITSEEKRFSRIFQQYNSREIGDTKWAEIAGDKASESYTLQDGDNLWDISTKLFGNGFYWSKVWQLNDDITNPHLVSTGKNLQFTPGSSNNPPSLGVEANLDQQITEATSDTDENIRDEEAPEFDTIVTQNAPEGDQIVIPPGIKSRPVLNKIPPSFTESYKTTGEYDRTTGFAKEGLKRIEPKIHPGAIPSIVVEKVWEPDGKIIELEGDSTVASTYQTVIMKISGPAKLGDTFTVFSSNGKVTDPTTGYTIGVELETRAEIEIQEVVEGSSDTYRGTIMFTDMPVRLGDSVKLGHLITRVNFEADGPLSAVPARLVNGEANKRKVLGIHNIVYLDKGTEDGLQNGSLLYVLKNIEVRNDDTTLKFDSRPIGLIKTVEVEPHVATAIIVSEKDAIMPGDMTQLQAPELSDNPKSVDDIKPLEDTVVKDED